jgi:hypothetical protein
MIMQTRDTKTANYVVYNDIEKEVTKDVISALDNYNIKHIPWTKKEQCLIDFSFN